MDQTRQKTYMTFPCDFPLKIIGKNHDQFQREIIAIVQKHFSTLHDEQILVKPSQHGNYLALSIVITVHDQASLDALYQELTQHPDIKMVL